MRRTLKVKVDVLELAVVQDAMAEERRRARSEEQTRILNVLYQMEGVDYEAVREAITR